MKRLIACVITVAAILMGFPALAVLVASESFEYPDGSIDEKNGGTGFSGAWSQGNAANLVASPGLPAIALPTSGGRLELNSSDYATRSADFTDFHFHIDATSYASVIVNKGGTVEGGSGEYLEFDIRASSGVIAGFTFGSNEDVTLKLRKDSVKGTEKLDLDTDYLFLMKLISSTSSDEQLFLTWYKVGDAIPEDDASVVWKLSLTIANNTIGSNNGLRTRTGANISGDVDEFKLGTELSDVLVGVPQELSATIMDWFPLTENIMRMEVNVAGDLDAYKPQAKMDLNSGSWTNVPHSDDGSNAFVVTNLSYSTESGSNQVFYVNATNAFEFFRILGE